MDKIIVDYSGQKRTNSSKVWQFFGFYKDGDKINKDITVCKICKAEKPYKGYSTSNMMAHLTTFHNDLVNPGKAQDVQRQPSITSFSAFNKPMSRDSKMYKDCTELLTDCLLEICCRSVQLIQRNSEPLCMP